MRKQPVHLIRRLNVELLRVELEPLRVVHRVCRLHTQQHLVRARVPVLDVVRVVCRHQRNAQVLLQPEHGLGHRLVGPQPMVLDLQKEVPLAEHLLKLAADPLGPVVLPSHQELAHLPCQTSRKPNQPLAVLRQKLL